MTNAGFPQQSATLTIDQALHQAIEHHQTGQLQDAERLYRAILQFQPDHPDANHNLGVLLVQVKQSITGLQHLKAALESNPNQFQFWLSYLHALMDTGQFDVARQVLEQGRQRGLPGDAVKALELRLEESQPSSHEKDTLVALFAEGRHSEAESLAQALTVRYPLHVLGWRVLGAILQQMGRLDEAEASCRRALQNLPDFAEAHAYLGDTLKDLGRLDEAEASYRRAIQINPDFAEAHCSLGNTLTDLGRLDEAEACYWRALQIRPNFTDPLDNLALLFNAQGNSMMALRSIDQSLQIKETWQAKYIFVDCIKSLRFTHNDSENRRTMVRALTESWGQPNDLAQVGVELVKLDPNIKKFVTRANSAWPQRLSAQDFFGENSINGFTSVASDPLLCALLDSGPILDTEMERFLTMARWALLETVTEKMASEGGDGMDLDFYCALARQCFINEYVFSLTDAEIRKASDLRDSLVSALQARVQVPVLLPITVAAYFPLCTLPFAAQLLDMRWHETVMAILVQQICEPEEERQLRTTIPQLSCIEDEVSLRVQHQYEENPYPRWVKIASNENPVTVGMALRRLFPLVSFQQCMKYDTPDILIAGCGTGQHSIETAQRFQGARILAVDLSMASLCYAKRKTRETGVTSIEYAQADLLQLESLGRSFDVIEASGVLHHLVDPLAGWRVLLSLLHPGGFMKLGFYSEVARRNIVQIQAFIAEQDYGTTVDEVRRCRQDLLDLPGVDKSADFRITLEESPDFFSISTCRDLLFHVQERRLSLSGIDAFLRDNNLVFLGFDIDQHVLCAYQQRFPDDCAATNLGKWQIFENENPDTFLGMYQFWTQKVG